MSRSNQIFEICRALYGCAREIVSWLSSLQFWGTGYETGTKEIGAGGTGPEDRTGPEGTGIGPEGGTTAEGRTVPE